MNYRYINNNNNNNNNNNSNNIDTIDNKFTGTQSTW